MGICAKTISVIDAWEKKGIWMNMNNGDSMNERDRIGTNTNKRGNKATQRGGKAKKHTKTLTPICFLKFFIFLNLWYSLLIMNELVEMVGWCCDFWWPIIWEMRYCVVCAIWPNTPTIFFAILQNPKKGMIMSGKNVQIN